MNWIELPKKEIDPCERDTTLSGLRVTMLCLLVSCVLLLMRKLSSLIEEGKLLYGPL